MNDGDQSLNLHYGFIKITKITYPEWGVSCKLGFNRTHRQQKASGSIAFGGAKPYEGEWHQLKVHGIAGQMFETVYDPGIVIEEIIEERYKEKTTTTKFLVLVHSFTFESSQHFH